MTLLSKQKEQHTALQLVHTPQSISQVALLLFVMFIFSLIVLIYTPWQQTLKGSGRVIAFVPAERQQKIEAPVYGRIDKWFVSEGTQVKKGQLLAEISDLDPQLVERLNREKLSIDARIKAAELKQHSIEQLISSLQLSKSNSLDIADMMIQMAEAKLRASEEVVNAAKAEFQTAQLNLNRQIALKERGLASTRKLELAQLKYQQSVAKFNKGKADYQAMANDLQAKRRKKLKISNDADAKINKERSSLASAQSDFQKTQQELAKIEVKLNRQSSQVIKAPRSGTIFRILKNQGAEFLKQGSPLAILVPDLKDIAVELWVDGNDIPLISKGQQVRLQFEGWPALQFSGWPSVAVGTFGGVVKLVDSTDDGKGNFRIVVVPDSINNWPSKRFLRQGVQVHGWVMLNQVKLWFELWRQFNGFPPAIYDFNEPEKKKMKSPLKNIKS